MSTPLQLRISLHDAEGALLRVLGTAERRGFRILALHAECTDGNGCELAMTLAGTRDAALLARQLGRLHEVRAVRVGA